MKEIVANNQEDLYDNYDYLLDKTSNNVLIRFPSDLEIEKTTFIDIYIKGNCDKIKFDSCIFNNLFIDSSNNLKEINFDNCIFTGYTNISNIDTINIKNSYSRNNSSMNLTAKNIKISNTEFYADVTRIYPMALSLKAENKSIINNCSFNRFEYCIKQNRDHNGNLEVTETDFSDVGSLVSPFKNSKIRFKNINLNDFETIFFDYTEEKSYDVEFEDTPEITIYNI